MKKLATLAAIVLAAASAACDNRASNERTNDMNAAQGRKISFNGRALAADELAAWEQLEQRGRFRLPDGAYWYDIACGAAGQWGGPTQCFLPAGLRFCGAMPANCSGGGTGVFINGRELHAMDVAALQQFMMVMQGRWWVDAMGNFGQEGGWAMGNLVQLAAQRGGRGGGGGGGAWSHYYDGGSGNRISVGGDGNGDYYYSDSSGNSWWPGK